jgi:hypothetical protein
MSRHPSASETTRPRFAAITPWLEAGYPNVPTIEIPVIATHARWPAETDLELFEALANVSEDVTFQLLQRVLAGLRRMTFD